MVEHVVLVRRDHPQAPARGPEILGERIHQQRVLGADREQRLEFIGKGAVDIVGEDQQVGPLLGHDGAHAVQAALVHLHGRRVAGVHAEEDLDVRVLELVQLGVGVLPAVVGVGVDGHFLEVVLGQFGDLDIRREHRHADGHLVAGLEQAADAQALEDIGHGRRAALDREQVHRLGWHGAACHLAHDVLAHDLLAHGEHARRHGVVAAQDAVHHLVQEGGGVQPQLVAHIAQRLAQELHPLLVAVLGDKALEAPLDAVELGQPAHAHRHVGVRQLRLRRREQPQPEEGPARRGRQEVGIATPRIEHEAVGLARGHLDQFVLEFERAQIRQTPIILAHCAAPCDGPWWSLGIGQG
ncbi:hypothetical protein KDK82_1863 [Delftia sp. K82]|nr:hypothetical protein KDK82_1863 [Delftia sp. K82]